MPAEINVPALKQMIYLNTGPLSFYTMSVSGQVLSENGHAADLCKYE